MTFPVARDSDIPRLISPREWRINTPENRVKIAEKRSRLQDDERLKLEREIEAKWAAEGFSPSDRAPL